MNKIILASVSILALAACGGPATSPKVNQLVQSGGVKVAVELGNPRNMRDSSFTTKWFNAGFNSTKIDFPVKVSFVLDNSPASQAIRKAGDVVYIYTRPRYVFEKKTFKDGKVRIVKEHVNRLGSGGFCDGYYVALAPQNNYSLSYQFTQDFTMRNKDTGFDFGVWGRQGSSDWGILSVEGGNAGTEISSRPFLTDHGTRLYSPCYLKETRAFWR